MTKNNRKWNIILVATYIFLFLFVLGSAILFGALHLEDNIAFEKVAYILNLVSLFAFFIIAVIEFASPFFIKESNWTTAFLAIGIFFTIMFSYDSLKLLHYLNLELDISSRSVLIIYRNMFFTSIILSDLFFYKFFVRNFKIHVVKIEYYITIALIGVIHILYIVLSFYDLHIIPHQLLFVLCLYWFIKFVYTAIKQNKINFIFVISSFIFILFLSSGFTCSLVDVTDNVISGRGIVPIATILCFIGFFAIYLYFTITVSRKAYQKEEIEKRLNELQASTLKNQINPHFLFNALNVIKTLYNTDKEKADYAVDLLSRHLRAFVDAGDTFVVPLERELKIVEGYLELENLKVSKPFNIIYDIDVYDFLVPYFAIQTLIENAVRYSCINEKEDGHISISTYEEGEYYFLIISDNGVGFDPNKVMNKSIGLKNARERFKISLDATFEIQSIIDKGTTITIKIPKEKGQIKS